MTLTISDDTGTRFTIPPELEEKVVAVLKGGDQPMPPQPDPQHTMTQASTQGPRPRARSGDDRIVDVVVNGEGAKLPDPLNNILWGYSAKEGLGNVSTEREEMVDRLKRENICRSVYLSNKTKKVPLRDLLQIEYLWNREYARSRSYDGKPSLVEMLLQTFVHQKTEMTTAVRDRQSAADVIKGFFRGGGGM